jgi:uncharacterized protein YbcI
VGNSSTVLGAAGVNRAIAHSLAALHREHLGKGPNRVKCYLHDDCVLVLMYEGHTRSEATLEAGGEQKAVAEQRVRSSDAIHDEFISVVEAATERKVIGYMSSSQQEPSLLSHVFVLDPTDLLDDLASP